MPFTRTAVAIARTISKTPLKPLRAGIVGLGVGEAHLRSYQAIEGVEVAAVCDIDPDRLGEIANRYSVAERHGDYRAITEDPEIDVVSICSHDDAHAEQLISAFRNGKHVMVEKPVALNRREADSGIIRYGRTGPRRLRHPQRPMPRLDTENGKLQTMHKQETGDGGRGKD